LTKEKPTPTRVSKILWTIAWCTLVFLILDNIRIEIGSWLLSGDPSRLSPMLADHIDVPLILHSLQSKPTFASTFAWWHSSWIPEVPFWRPLSIQGFWIEAHVFTTRRYDLWMWVSCIGHLLMLAALAAMTLAVAVRDLERRADRIRRFAVVWLTLWIFAAERVGGISPTFLGDLFIRTPADIVLYAWKNQPDIFTDLFVFLTLTFVAVRQWWPVLVCAFVAVAFKESGWMAWLLAGVLLAIGGEWRQVPKSVYVAAGVSIFALLALRWISGSEVFRGFHQGTNHSWWRRFEIGVGGNYLDALVELPYCFILGHILVVVSWLRSRGRRVAGYVTLALGISGAIALQMRMTDSPLDATIVSYLDPHIVSFRTLLVLGVYVQVSGVWLALRTPFYRRLWLFAAIASVLSAMPFAAAAQVQIHALHQTFAFESMAWAIIFVALIDRWRVDGLALWSALRMRKQQSVPATT